MLEDYRAGLCEDHGHDERARADGMTIACPLLVGAWAVDVRAAQIDCGHHVAEEKPAELAALLRAFLA